MADNEYAYDNVGDGLKLVATAGTAVQLAAATAVRKVTIQARPENTDVVVVGASTVVAASGTRRGIALLPGASVTLNVKDLSDLYVDAVTNNDGVSYVYFW